MKIGIICKTCRECNKPFNIPTSEQLWLKERNLVHFERCKACRKARKFKRNHVEKRGGGV